jgi:DNA-binding NarL/FixJ family response regulator
MKNVAAVNRSLLPALAPQLKALSDVFESAGVLEWSISSTADVRRIKARTMAGEAVTLTQIVGPGYQEQTVSRCAGLTIKQRRIEAKKLRKRGLTQADIAERLGVSQKTISNDLTA